MSIDPSLDVMRGKDAAEARRSTNQLKDLIATSRGEMRRAVSNLSAESGLGSLQRRALEGVRSERIRKVSELGGRVQTTRLLQPDAVAPYPYSGPVVAQTGSGWTLNPSLARAFDEAARAASGSLNAPVKESLTDRLFRDVKGTRTRSVEDSVDIMCRVVASMTKAIEALDADAARSTGRRGDEARAMRQAAEDRLTESLKRHAEIQGRLPAPLLPWANEAWTDWHPGPVPSGVYAGVLRPKYDPALGDNGDFGRDVYLPFYVRPDSGVHLFTQKGNRQATKAMVRALLIRTLAAQVPGNLHLTVFDPIGLGQSVAPLLELAEYDQDLLGGKVWSNAPDFKVRLSEFTVHIEMVVQKFLRSDYATLAEFNSAAGEIAAPHRLLVVFDFPTTFEPESFSELRRIIETGPRCGVGTLLITNGDEPLPHGIDLGSLPETMTRINMGAPFSFSGSSGYDLMCDFDPDSDTSLPTGMLDRLVRAVGSGARDGGKQSIGFGKVFGLFTEECLRGVRPNLPRLATSVDLADESTWWMQSSLEGISAPIGQRGARDAAVLTLDSSNHSGALLVGRPGSGKSTLVHTYIAGVTTLYGPEELELHLIDFKEGVEFKVYAANGLPHARSVAVESDREFGVSVLQAIQAELSWRGSLLRGTAESHSSLEALRQSTGERLPRILLIFDEFQVLFSRNDRLGTSAAELLESLIRQGRGFGIHLLLGSQSLSGLDALGSHVPQLLPVRILLPAAEADAYKVLGEANTEGTTLITAGDGILNMANGAVEANQRFRGALVDEGSRGDRVKAMRERADAAGFARRPVIFEGNAPIPAEDTPPAQFIDEIRGGHPRALRLRFGSPMALSGSADIDLRRESGANVLLVARDVPVDVATPTEFSVPRAVASNIILSAAARGAQIELVDFLPADEGLGDFAAPLIDASAAGLSRRRQVPDLLRSIARSVDERIAEDNTTEGPTLLVLYGMHRARDFDQDSLDYDPGADLGELLSHILRDGPEVGMHTFAWFDTLGSIGRRLPPSASREMSWRLAGRMSAEDSSSLLGVEAAGSLREQQVVAANEDRGLVQRCTTIGVPPPTWVLEMLSRLQDRPNQPKM